MPNLDGLKNHEANVAFNDKIYEQPASSSYQHECFYTPEKTPFFHDEIAALRKRHPTRTVTLDLRRARPGAITKEFIANIPPGVTKVLLPPIPHLLTDDDCLQTGKKLAYLPPHIRHIQLPCAHELNTDFDAPDVPDRNALIARLLPPTLHSAIIGAEPNMDGRSWRYLTYFEADSFRHSVYPESYAQVFNMGAAGTINPSGDRVLTDEQLVQGMVALLEYYLGMDNRGSNKPFFSNPLRSSFRDHRTEVNEIVQSIRNPEEGYRATSLDILNRLKALEPANQKGGLQMRIHFLQEAIGERDQKRQGHQPAASSSVR